jgi:hypothetical protein
MSRAQRRAYLRGESPDDLGTVELRAKKRRVTGREDLDISGAAALHGSQLIDAPQYATLSGITLLLQRLQGAWGGTGGVEGLWRGYTRHTFTQRLHGRGSGRQRARRRGAAAARPDARPHCRTALRRQPLQLAATGCRDGQRQCATAG